MACEACENGHGHQVDIDLDDPPFCVVRCYGCRKTLRFLATHTEECCDHIYVGEDEWRAQEYYGEHDDHSDEF